MNVRPLTGLALVIVGALIAIISGMQDWAGFVLVIFAPLSVALILQNPSWGLWLILLLFPLAAAAPNGGLFLAVNYLMPLLILYSVSIRLLHKRQAPPQLDPRLAKWFIAYTLCIVGTSAFHVSPVSSLVVAYRYFILFLMITLYAKLWNQKTLGRGLLAFSFVLVPVALIGLYTMASEGVAGVLFERGTQPDRLTSIYANPNIFGQLMSHGLVVLMAYLLVPRRQKTTLGRGLKWSLILVFVLILGAGLIISFSRSSYIYCAVALLALLFTKRKIRWLAFGSAGAMMVALFVMPLPVWMYLVLRVGSGLSFRTSLWEAGWGMFKEHPLTGIGTGTGTFELFRPEYLDSFAFRGLIRTQVGSAHNVFVARAAELGILGLLLVVILFVVLLIRVPSHLRRFGNGDWVSGAAAAGVLGLIAHGWFESGATVGMGKINSGLMFFLFAVVLLRDKKGRLEV